MVDKPKIVFEGQPKPRLIVVLEGGVVQSALSNVEIETFVLDYDVEELSEAENDLVRVPQGENVEPWYQLASLFREKVEIVPDERLDQIINLKYPNGNQATTT